MGIKDLISRFERSSPSSKDAGQVAAVGDGEGELGQPSGSRHPVASQSRNFKVDNEIQASMKLQASARRFLEFNKFKKKRKLHRHRSKVAMEILSTEKSCIQSTLYSSLFHDFTVLSILTDVDGLANCQKYYLRPIGEAAASGKPIINIGDASTNLVVILQFHQMFLLPKLQELMQDWTCHSRIGPIFLEVGEMMKIYKPYINCFDTAVTTVGASQHAKGWKKFQEAKKEEVGFDIMSYLIMPVQRIPRYVMLLEDMLKHTWDDHCDREAIGSALDKISGVAAEVNEAKRRAEDMNKVLEVQDSISSLLSGIKKDAGLTTLVDPARRYIRQGRLRKFPSGGLVKGGQDQGRQGT